MITKQKNVRFDELTLALLDCLVSKDKYGTQSEIVRKGIILVAEKYLSEEEYKNIVFEYLKK